MATDDTHAALPTQVPHEGAAAAPHVLPVALYVKVFAALVVLTGLTVTIGYLGLGAASLMVAITIAVIKAGFVIGFFMHLRYENRFLAVIFFASVLFLLIFFALTFADVRSRSDLIEAEGNTALEVDRADAARLLQKAPPPPAKAPAKAPSAPTQVR
jgi:cytochrome c oxidase subunit 4